MEKYGGLWREMRDEDGWRIMEKDGERLCRK